MSPEFTAVDPDVLDEIAAYGPEPSESADERAERLARAFEHGATLRLDVPPADEVPGEPTGEAPRRRRRRTVGDAASSPRRRTVAGGQIGTLFVAGASILIGFTIGEWAAPTTAEADAMAVPLGNILARRIDLASKLGKDTDDVVTLAIAIMAWMARVGPVAAGRARNAYADRTSRRNAARVDGPPQPIRPPDDRGTGSLVDGRNDGPRTPLGASHSPLDAVAAVRASGLGYLARDLGTDQDNPAPMVD